MQFENPRAAAPSSEAGPAKILDIGPRSLFLLFILALALSFAGCSGGDSAVGPPDPEPLEGCDLSSDGFNPALGQELLLLMREAVRFEGSSGAAGESAGEPLGNNLPCWSLVSFIESPPSDFETTQLMIAKNEGTGDLAVTFPGSSRGPDETDWYNNFNVLAADWVLDGNCEDPNASELIGQSVHQGFMFGYTSIRDELRNRLLAAMPAPEDRATARVMFSGHSLGGALATLASLDLVNTLVREGYARENIVMYSVAAPRAMKPALANKFDCLVPNSFLIAVMRDPVPRLKLGGYTHIKNTVALIGKGDASWDPSDAWQALKGKLDQSPPPKTRAMRIAGARFPATVLGTGDQFPACDLAYNWGFHQATVYSARLKTIQSDQTPQLKFRVLAGLLEIGAWNGIPDKCESIILFRGSPGDFSNAILTTFRPMDGSVLESGTYSPTAIPRYGGYHLAYLDQTGRVIDSKQYEPATPALQLSTEGPLNRIRIKWSVPDAGLLDYIAVYDSKPSNGGANSFIVGTKVPVFPFGEGGSVLSAATTTLKGKWVAYVMKDATPGVSRSRILNEKKID